MLTLLKQLLMPSSRSCSADLYFADDSKLIEEAIGDLDLVDEQKDQFLTAMDVAHQAGFVLQDGAGSGVVTFYRKGTGTIELIHCISVGIMSYPRGAVHVDRPRNANILRQETLDRWFGSKEFIEYEYGNFEECIQGMRNAFSFGRTMDALVWAGDAVESADVVS